MFVISYVLNGVQKLSHFENICRIFHALNRIFFQNLAAYFFKFCRIFLRSLSIAYLSLCKFRTELLSLPPQNCTWWRWKARIIGFIVEYFIFFAVMILIGFFTPKWSD